MGKEASRPLHFHSSGFWRATPLAPSTVPSSGSESDFSMSTGHAAFFYQGRRSRRSRWSRWVAGGLVTPTICNGRWGQDRRSRRPQRYACKGGLTDLSVCNKRRHSLPAECRSGLCSLTTTSSGGQDRTSRWPPLLDGFSCIRLCIGQGGVAASSGSQDRRSRWPRGFIRDRLCIGHCGVASSIHGQRNFSCCELR
jgi:hypothetical protein